MTTDPTPLQERIERELAEMFDGGGFSARDMARDLFPIIAAEVRKAQADALRQAADEFDGGVGMIDLDNALRAHGTPWTDAAVQAAHENSGALMDWLRARATEYEQEA